MDGWITLSDRATSPEVAHGLMERGLLVIEFALPLSDPTVLLDLALDTPWTKTFSVFCDPGSGLSILHRQDRSVTRHSLPLQMTAGEGVMRISFRFDAPARRWSMRAEGASLPKPAEIAGRNPMPLPIDDLQRLSIGGAGVRRHPAVLWFGTTRGAAPPARAPWIGLRTPVETDDGPQPAGLIAPGTLVETAEAGLLPVLKVHRHSLPSRGYFAPVLLRAPYFGNRSDLLVSADQIIQLGGPDVEYLNGDEEVLAHASQLVDGRVAIRDQRRSEVSGVALDFGRPVTINADGCMILCQSRLGDERMPRRLLHDFEALSLMSMRMRGSLRRSG